MNRHHQPQSDALNILNIQTKIKHTCVSASTSSHCNACTIPRAQIHRPEKSIKLYLRTMSVNITINVKCEVTKSTQVIQNAYGYAHNIRLKGDR